MMIRSLAGLWRVNPGFDPHNVLVFDLSFPATINSPEAIRAAWPQIHDTLNALPGVTVASLAGGAAPMSGDMRKATHPFRRAFLLRFGCVIGPASPPASHDATLPHTPARCASHIAHDRPCLFISTVTRNRLRELHSPRRGWACPTSLVGRGGKSRSHSPLPRGEGGPRRRFYQSVAGRVRGSSSASLPLCRHCTML